MNFKDQYQNPKWQKRRLEIMSRDSYTCQCCQSEDNTLNVHHRYYIKGNNIWEYEDDALTTLCSSCHSQIHKFENDLKYYLSKIPMWRYSSLIEIMSPEELAGIIELSIDNHFIAEAKSLNEYINK